MMQHFVFMLFSSCFAIDLQFYVISKRYILDILTIIWLSEFVWSEKIVECKVKCTNSNYFLHTERCRSYRSYKYIPFAYYQSLHNSYNVHTSITRSNRNQSFFPTRVSPALRYPNKVVRYSAGLRTDQINL